MRLPEPIFGELWFVVVATMALWLAGSLAGHASLFLLLGALAYIGWHLYNLVRLAQWLAEGKKFHAPEAPGIWGEVFYLLYRLQQRHRKRKQKITSLLMQYQESTAALPDATVILGAKGECEWWNEAAHTLLGLYSGKDEGQRIDNLVRHPEFTRYLAEGDYTQRVTLPSPIDSEVTLLIRIVPYAETKRLLVARDVTYIERLEEIRRDFVANVSHELRTPLTVISGYLETLLESTGEQSEHFRAPLQQMQLQARRMQRIVDDLLLLARLESGRRGAADEAVDVPAMLAAVVDDARALSGAARHDISLTAQPGLWLHGQAGDLRSAFSNLLFNAVKYTPEAGRIQVRWYADDAGAHLQVADTGPGIASHHIPRLTERFYRVDVGRSRERGGTGLGLAIVKHVLQYHHGNLQVSSKPGEGSVFQCDFPTQAMCGPGGHGMMTGETGEPSQERLTNSQ